MNLPINVKSPNNISKWQMEFNSAFKGLMLISNAETALRLDALRRQIQWTMDNGIDIFNGHSVSLDMIG
jgi:hypothetical protein